MSEVAGQLRDLGIERGWGSTVGSIRSTMLMLGDIIQAPDPETLQAWPCTLHPGLRKDIQLWISLL